jgi:hypothetical protein
LLITLSRGRAFENPLPIRDLRFDPVPSGWSDSSTERFSKLGYYSHASPLTFESSKIGKIGMKLSFILNSLDY